MKMMFDAVSDLVSPGERLKLLDAVILNVLICNSDSHAKNYSILIGAGGSAKMAPLYDRMCAAAYRQVDQSLPQGISGRFHAPDLRRADWQALADEVGLSGASTLKRDATCLITCPPVDLFSCSLVLLFSCSLVLLFSCSPVLLFSWLPIHLFSSPPNRLFSHSFIFARSHVEHCFGSSGYRGGKRDRSTRCGCMHDGSSSYAERGQDGPPLMSGSYISWRPVRAVYQ